MRERERRNQLVALLTLFESRSVRILVDAHSPSILDQIKLTWRFLYLVVSFILLIAQRCLRFLVFCWERKETRKSLRNFAMMTRTINNIPANLSVFDFCFFHSFFCLLVSHRPTSQLVVHVIKSKVGDQISIFCLFQLTQSYLSESRWIPQFNFWNLSWNDLFEP